MKKESGDPVWVDYATAQHLTWLGRTTLWKICSAEDSGIEVARVGRAVRINRASLMNFMKRQAREGVQSYGPSLGLAHVKKQLPRPIRTRTQSREEHSNEQ